MSEHPWDADRELTVAQATSAIQSQFPEVAANVVQPIGSGWDNDAFVVDDRWIFRFPRCRDVADQLDKERRLAPIVAQALSDLGIAVPAMSMPGQPCDDFPYRFTGYPRLPGIPADQLPEGQIDTTAVADALGAALARLHSISADSLTHVGLPTDSSGPAHSLAEVRESADLLRALDGPDVQRCLEWVMDSSVLPPPYAGELRFVHSDIATEHIFVDPETGRLVGLLDFGDAVFGDPAIDFASLPSQLGWEATEAALGTYSIPIDRGFLDRLEFMSRANPLTWLHYAHLQGGDVEKHRRWVLNAFGSG